MTKGQLFKITSATALYLRDKHGIASYNLIAIKSGTVFEYLDIVEVGYGTYFRLWAPELNQYLFWYSDEDMLLNRMKPIT